MKKLSVVLLLMIALTGCTSCTKGYVKASEIEPMVDAVVERHNGYIDKGSETDPARAETFKNEANVLKAAVNTAAKGGNK